MPGSFWGTLGPWIKLLVVPQVSNLKIILQSLMEYSQDVSSCERI